MTAASDTTQFICLFHDSDRAHAAIDALEGAGFPRAGITVLGGAARGSDGISTDADTLSGIGVPDRDLKHLRDGLSSGGAVIALQAPEGRSGEIEKIFHHYSADKIDETELGGTTTGAVPAMAATAAEGAVIPVVAEEMVVGKREVDRGGVRVFRRVVEEPVNESVSLHEERVNVQRRTVDRPVTDADLRAGSQEIELIETAEVPVVSKVARVVEEVRVGKVESDRTETVQDTVRHTEVDLEPVPGETSTTRRTEQ